MSTLYQMLGTGAKWVLKGNYNLLSTNQSPSVSSVLLSSRKNFVKILCMSSSLSSQPYVSFKDDSSAETGRTIVPRNVSLCHTNSSSLKIIPPKLPNSDLQLTVGEVASTMHNELTTDDESEKGLPPRKALDKVFVEKSSEISSFIDDIDPAVPVSFNLAAYVNKSESLQQLVKLGVDLSYIEESQGLNMKNYISQLDFEQDMKNHIQFLHDVGVPADELGKFLTANPRIFREDLDNLRIRINYLETKKFSSEAIARIVSICPGFLSLEVKTVDRRLGFFQKTFKLTGNEVRFLITKCPKLVPYKYECFMERIFMIKETMGFSEDEMKKLLLMKPKLYMLGMKSLAKRWNILHTVMGISHEHLLHFPGIFLTRDYKIEQRHKYLVKCGRAQYDPTQPNYISLEDIAILHDGEFCRKCAGTSVLEFDEFLKTL